jgi:two-component system sensor histidine kinase MtrB
VGRIAGVARAAVRRWRRSLQLRVVATTLLVASLAMVGLGTLLVDQVVHGLLTAKQRSALAETDAGLLYAQSELSQADLSDQPGALDELVEGVMLNLEEKGGGGSVYAVGLVPISPGVSGYQGAGFSASEVPARLASVISSRQSEATTYTTADVAGRPTPSLLVGAPLVAPTGTSYTLYFSFPLTSEQQTVALLRRTVEIGGLVLALLLCGLVAYLTRRVVTPVRLAAEAADRLAAGRLEERLAVRGEDEIARLGRAFNSMATALASQIRELEELSRVQHRFTSDVSHELRTPLTTVRMAAEVLHEARAGFPPALARSAELLIGEVDRFEALLVDLLEISRFDAGVAQLEAEPVDLAALVRDEVANATPLAERRGVTLDASTLPQRPVIAEVDPRRARRIVRNLLSNAVEHGEGRPVEVTLGWDADAAAVRVRDHGIGLNPGESSLVFLRFWRSDPSRTRMTGGTGLGLSISLEDARLHGGWLQAWGERGRGSAFRLVLPRRQGHPVLSAPLPLDDAAPPDVTVPGPAVNGERAGSSQGWTLTPGPG